MKLLSLYSFKIILIGTSLLAIISAIVGSLNVYKSQSLIGDALGHSTYPGIILSFMLSGQKNPTILLIGAMLTASLSYFLIQYSNRNSKIGADANMAIHLTGFFGLGLLLKSYIQGNPVYSQASKAGLDKYIFGQAAYLMKEDIFLLAIAFLICLFIIILNYRDIKCYLFDREFAEMMSIRTNKLDYLILFMTILVIGLGIKTCGVILISSLLIIPTITAAKLSDKFIGVLIISSLLSVLASVVGSIISTAYVGFSTGPTIILCQGFIAILVITFTKFLKIRS
ncbi:metal ABC transporter permease [Anaerococcus nagyae]|uniref:metal ABC transporter permease n=1 Tax=Anaerococcus nagyae TaxID=1755241 RepID=UPI001AE43E97|nr:metal ABC transporter permease [Anaerococcus nagyae]MBP2069074.1 manganese/zinc/iron transport system permease protein [Anaerococcus nagyae]